jgi:hypothetical protein
MAQRNVGQSGDAEDDVITDGRAQFRDESWTDPRVAPLRSAGRPAVKGQKPIIDGKDVDLGCRSPTGLVQHGRLKREQRDDLRDLGRADFAGQSFAERAG